MSKKKRSISISLLAFICCAASVLWSCAARMSTEQIFSQAESCSKELQGRPGQQKHRSDWLRCIDKFDEVYKQDPKGPRAADALYQMGCLYQGLYTYSYKDKDLAAAEKIFKQIVKNFPGSAYKTKAAESLATMPMSAASVERQAAAKKLYLEAEADYHKLLADSSRVKYRGYWLDNIQKFESAYQTDPDGVWSAASLYMMGTLYANLYKYSFKPEDDHNAKETLEKVIREHTDSAYAQKAAESLGIDINTFLSAQNNDKGAPKNITGQPGVLATVTGIRYWSNPEYTRVVINADRDAEIESNLLKKDPSIDQANQRLYVDIKNSRLGNIDTTIPINDSLLKTARAGQYTADTVRVVIDINSFEAYNVFSLSNPFRIVIDVRGKPVPKTTAPQEIQGPDTASIAKQLALGVQRIIVDEVHGGKDCGAPGYVKGVHEKMIVLEIARKLANKIRSEIGCEVIMTRSDDTYLTLEERTGIANMKKGDLFISIHANSAINRTAFGIETYFLNLTTDDESISVAARENATSTKNISELQTILNDLLQNAKINESSRLATYVQKELCCNLSKKYNRINNKGVKQAPFYVLIGAQMPAILVETAFISNSTECQRLMDPKYQNSLCDGIIKGIRKYIAEIQPTATFGKPEKKGGRG